MEAAHTGQHCKSKWAGQYQSIAGAIAYWDEVKGRFGCRVCHKKETIHEIRTGANPSFEPRKCRGGKGDRKKWTDIQQKWVYEQNAKRSEFKRFAINGDIIILLKLGKGLRPSFRDVKHFKKTSQYIVYSYKRSLKASASTPAVPSSSTDE